MSSAQVARLSARSQLAEAAFLSLLPGLGHTSGGGADVIGFAEHRPLLLAALISGIVAQMDRLELVGVRPSAWVLTWILVLDVRIPRLPDAWPP